MAGNLYKNWGPEQRERWNEYNNKYSKTHFRTINIKLRLDEDSDIIEFINNHKETSISDLVRIAIRSLIEDKK